MAAVTQVTARIEHDIDDGSGRVVKIVLEGLAGPSFELYAEPVLTGGGLRGELHVIGEDGRNHGSKPFLVQVPPGPSPLATAQAFAEQAWAVLDQEYVELIFSVKHSKMLSTQINQRVRALVLENKLRKQQVLGDIVDAFVKTPEPKWTGWKKGFVVAKLDSCGIVADQLQVDGPTLEQFYSIAQQAMQGGVKTFDAFVAKLRSGLGDQFNPFLKAVGGFTGLHPIWDAVIEQDEDDLVNSLDDMRISPRQPWAKEAPRGVARETPLENPHGADKLQPGLEPLSRDPDAFAANVALLESYPNFTGITGKGSVQDQAEAIIELMKNNLIWLYNSWGTNLRKRSKAWYVGGNRLVHRWSAKFGLKPHQVAGCLASLSPQKDWFQNVSLAERVMTAVCQQADQPWSPAMTALLTGPAKGKDNVWSKPSSGRPSPVDLLPELEGKTLHQLQAEGNLYGMAIWVRAWDEATNPHQCRQLTPEGEFGDWYLNNDGTPTGLAWGGFDTISKAIGCVEATNNKVISSILSPEGKTANHKVRSFYNNLIAPLSSGGDVTIDTHAVAAALIRPLAGTSREVLHNFGQNYIPVKGQPGEPGPVKSSVHGNAGLYGFYAEAYRRAANELGVQPRELQSITWESVRGLFRPEQKDAKLQSQVDHVWSKFAKGSINADTARSAIVDHAGGIQTPSWAQPHTGGDEIPRDSSYQGELPADEPSGAEPGRATASRAGSGAAARIPELARGRVTGRTAKLLQPKLAHPVPVPPELVDTLARRCEEAVRMAYRNNPTTGPASTQVSVADVIPEWIPAAGVHILSVQWNLSKRDTVSARGGVGPEAMALDLHGVDVRSMLSGFSPSLVHEVKNFFAHELSHMFQWDRAGYDQMNDNPRHNDLGQDRCNYEVKAISTELCDSYGRDLQSDRELTVEGFIGRDQRWKNLQRGITDLERRRILRDLYTVQDSHGVERVLGRANAALSRSGDLPLPESPARSAGRRVAKLLQPKTAEQIKDDTYSMSLGDAIDEHEKLVHALETPSHVDDAEEAKEQGGELQEMLEAQRKQASGSVTLFHGTSPEAASRIRKRGFNTPWVYLTNDYEAAQRYGEVPGVSPAEVMRIRVPRDAVHMDFDLGDAKLLDVAGANSYQREEWDIDEWLENHGQFAVPRAVANASLGFPSGGARRKHAKLLRKKSATPQPGQVAQPQVTLNTANEVVAWAGKFLTLYTGMAAVEAYLTTSTDDRLSFLMGPDGEGASDAVAFTEGFNGRVKTQRLDRTKLNGALIAKWILTKLGGAFPMTALIRITTLPKLVGMSAQQIEAGALDKMLKPYPDTLFKLWLLRTWATESYLQVGDEGSSRICYQIDKEHALKIAMNPAGVAQNQVEEHIARNFNDLPIAQVLFATQGSLALVVDYAHALVPADFRRDFGLDFGTFCSRITQLTHAKTPADRQVVIDDLPPGTRKLVRSLQQHELSPDDLKRPEQWGDVKQHAVIIDYGLTHKVWDDHYNFAKLKAKQVADKDKRLPPTQAERRENPVRPKPPVQETSPLTAKLLRPKTANVYDGYCPICGVAGCGGHCYPRYGGRRRA